jgi:hypothetical protein
VARVVCDEHGAAAPTRRVRAQRDGVHIIVENRSNARELYIRDAEEEGWNHGGRLKAYEANDIRTTLPPGEILIGCFRNIGDAPYSETNVPEYARITIVDPDRLWIPIGLACDDARSAGTFDAGRIVADPPASYEHIAREFVPGLKSTDELVRPGYPLTGWHGEPRLILREGEAVAHLDLYRQHSRWEVRVDACPGEDIGQNDI